VELEIHQVHPLLKEIQVGIIILVLLIMVLAAVAERVLMVQTEAQVLEVMAG